jgi:carbon-monoxide dehydrogenase large subunit
MIDGPASIASSINAALADLDAVADTIPATAHRVRRWIREAEADAAGDGDGTGATAGDGTDDD